MHLFLPIFDATRAERALIKAREIMRPGDCLIVMAPIIVPRGLPVDVDAGMIWKQVCRAERRLLHARAAAERILPTGVTLRLVRVQARGVAAAVHTGAAHYDADLILLDLPSGLRGMFALRFGAIAAVCRHAPCAVQFVGMMERAEPLMPLPEPIAIAPFPTLAVVAMNPALAAPAAGEREGTRALRDRPFP